MGGHVGGAAASAAAVEAVVEELGDLRAEPDAATLEAAVDWAAQRVREASGGGTTLVIALLAEDGASARVTWVGDSRAYLVPAGAAEAEQLTVDHSDGHALTAWLPDRAEPDTITVALPAGARLVLCTDGVSDVLDEEALAQLVLAEDDDPAEALVAEALDAGASDNCTAVVWCAPQ